MIHHRRGAGLAALRPRLVNGDDGQHTHWGFFGFIHSGGDGNRTRVRKAPMYGFSLRLNLFTPSLEGTAGVTVFSPVD